MNEQKNKESKESKFNLELFDGYFITADKYEYVLNETKIYEEGKNIGKGYTNAIGYYSTLQGVLKGFMQMQLKMSEIRTITELNKRINELEKIMTELVVKSDLVQA